MRYLIGLYFVALFLCVEAFAITSLFAKGSVSRAYTAADEQTITVSATGGLSIGIFPMVRLEGRYTNISALQNKVSIDTSSFVGTLTDYETKTEIYSVGIDFSLFTKRSLFQPFIYLGGGYLIATRTYTLNVEGGDSIQVPTQRDEGVSVNVGVGFRLFIASSIAFEVECFGYSKNIRDPNPLINLYGNVGIRLFI